MIWLKAVLFSLFCLAVLLVSMVFLSGEWTGLLIRYTSYYLVAAAFLVFLYFLIRHPGLRNFFTERAKGHRWGVLTVLICGSFLHLHEPHLFFVEYDESVLSATSRQMHLSREATVPGTTHYINGKLQFSIFYTDKRPVLFPFILSLAHDLTGYRPQNSFVVNALAGFLFLGGIYAFLTRIIDRRYGIFGVLLMTTLPLLAQNATGGGFDLLNVAMLVLVLNLGLNFVRNPEALNLNLFVFGLVLLSQARYESILYLIPGAIVIAIIWFHQRRILLTWPATCAPLLLLSPLLSIRMFTSNETFYQLDDRSDRFFDLSFIPENFPDAVFYFFQVDRDATNSPLISIFGFISLVFVLVLLYRLGKKPVTQPDWHSLFYPFLGVVLFNTVWALSNFWGQFTDPIVSRITLPLQMMLVFCVAITGKEFFGRKPLPPWIPVGVVLWILIYTTPANARAFTTLDHIVVRELEMAVKFAEENTTRRDFFIAHSSLPFSNHNRPGISIARAADSPGRIMRTVELGIYDNIYLLIRLREHEVGELRALEDTDIFDHFEMKLLKEERFRPQVVSHLYQITGLKPDSTGQEELQKLRDLPYPTDGDSNYGGAAYRIKQLP